MIDKLDILSKKTGLSNEEHPSWKGDAVRYGALHQWIRRHKPKSEICENCGKTNKLDAANISGEYKRDVNDFKWLCRKCHLTKDGRLYNFLGNRKDKTSWNKGLPKEQQPMYRKSFEHNEITKKKISLSKLGKKLSEEHKKKISIGNKGRKAWNTGLPKEMQLSYRKKRRKQDKLISNEVLKKV